MFTCSHAVSQMSQGTWNMLQSSLLYVDIDIIMHKNTSSWDFMPGLGLLPLSLRRCCIVFYIFLKSREGSKNGRRRRRNSLLRLRPCCLLFLPQNQTKLTCTKHLETLQPFDCQYTEHIPLHICPCYEMSLAAWNSFLAYPVSFKSQSGTPAKFRFSEPLFVHRRCMAAIHNWAMSGKLLPLGPWCDVGCQPYVRHLCRV